MELKYTNEEARKKEEEVLIVPLWNWNNDTTYQVQKRNAGFNRTFMELKYIINYRGDWVKGSFNRTFMELKFCSWVDML